MQRAVRADEEARHLQKRQKRKERERVWRERRAARGQLDGGKAGDGAKTVVVVGDVKARRKQPVLQFVAMATDTEVTAKSDELVRVSRTRQRYDKLARKAKAREDRKLREWLATQSYPDETYMAFVDTKRRRGKGGPRLSYQYESGSVYASPSVVWTEDGARPARVGRLRAVQALAVDSLPTAKVEVGDEWRDIKLDTGAHFCVAGESWKEYTERLGTLPPVDFVEGFTGAVAKVEGVWRFRFRKQYGQSMLVDAL
ncbi:hypothetical protein PHYSODRAFT_521494, partial [Phytophthora sojae]